MTGVGLQRNGMSFECRKKIRDSGPSLTYRVTEVLYKCYHLAVSRHLSQYKTTTGEISLRVYRWWWGTRWRSGLRHRATSRKVAGSIPDYVNGTFH